MKKVLSILAVMTLVLTFSVISFSAECSGTGGSGCNCVSNCSACSGAQNANHLSVTGGICPVCGGSVQVVRSMQPVEYIVANNNTNETSSKDTTDENDDTNFYSPTAPIYTKPGTPGSPVSPSNPSIKTVSVNDTGGGSGVSIVDLGGGKISPITGDNFSEVAVLGLSFLGLALFAARKLVK